MRETLETPSKTAMLVTPDRDLSRRVSAKMQRWGVTVDDSAGIPFHNSPCGTYLRLVAEWLNDRSNPVALMSLARHSLSLFGLDHGSAARSVNALDDIMRGLSPSAGGVANIIAKLDKSKKEIAVTQAKAIIKALNIAEREWPIEKGAPFSEYLEGHINAAEILASAADEQGPDRLWRGEDGDAGAGLIAGLRTASTAIGPPGRDYPA